MFFKTKSTSDFGKPKTLFLFSLLTFTALAYILVAAHELYRDIKCPVEILRQEAISGTNWVAQIRNGSCGFGSAEMVDIRVIDSNGYGAAVLATGYDIDKVVLDGSVPHRLGMTVPKGRDIHIYKAKVPGLAIDVRYKSEPSAAPQFK